MKLALIALVLAGCSAGDVSNASPPDGAGDPTPPAAPPPVVDPTCGIEFRFDPPQPIADPGSTIRVSVIGDGRSGVIDWSVALGAANVDFTYVQPDHTSIEFSAATPGVYVLSIDVADSTLACSHASRTLNVRAPGAKLGHFRLRIAPPPDLGVPPFEQPINIEGGANADLGAIVVDRGVPVALSVVGATGGVPAYVRFSPTGSHSAVVEAFADTQGNLSTTLADDVYSVLVVPSGPSGVPHRFPAWASAGSTDLSVVGGSPITGTVHDPVDAPIAGATVQLSIDGVPSTVTTTDAAGNFTVLAAATAGAVTVEVDPPAATGLPRLAATSATFNLAQPVQVRYAANLVRRSLGGMLVKRAGAAVANASVMVVGSLPAIGTVTAGTSATATGDVRIAATAGATGALPAQLIPGAQLSAVVTAAPGDLVVAALDATTTVPATLDAPAMQVIATGATDPDGNMLPGAVLDLVPSGALAMAGASPLHVIADGNGAFTAALAAGGHYDLRFLDPAGRAGPLVVSDVVATAVRSAGYALPKVLDIIGALLLGGTQALPGASVQILCSTCSGVDRSKPIAEGMSDETGRFILAVPDPGTM